MSPRRSKRASIPRSKYQDYVRVAESFCAGAEAAKAFEYWNAAGVLIVHAAIAYSDAMTIKIGGMKSQGDAPDWFAAPHCSRQTGITGSRRNSCPSFVHAVERSLLTGPNISLTDPPFYAAEPAGQLRPHIQLRLESGSDASQAGPRRMQNEATAAPDPFRLPLDKKCRKCRICRIDPRHSPAGHRSPVAIFLLKSTR